MLIGITLLKKPYNCNRYGPLCKLNRYEFKDYDSLDDDTFDDDTGLLCKLNRYEFKDYDSLDDDTFDDDTLDIVTGMDYYVN